MLTCEPNAIPFSTEALKSELAASGKWNGKRYMPIIGRNESIHILSTVYELVEWWAKEGKAVERAHRALHLRGYSSVREPEPFASHHPLHVRSR